MWRKIIFLGRDPRPVAIAPSGVGVVGAIAGVVEEESNLI